jgi:hypothetical protein
MMHLVQIKRDDLIVKLLSLKDGFCVVQISPAQRKIIAFLGLPPVELL